MRIPDGNSDLELSATDLANHLACKHLTHVNLALAQGKVGAPKQYWVDPEQVEAVQERGLRHEAAYIAHLTETSEKEDPTSVDLTNEPFEQTLSAMQLGVDLVTQATLESGNWIGRADILRRVARPSVFGDWSYEVIDTKLARETRAGTILQVCLYSDIIGEIQGDIPKFIYVVTPGTEEAGLFVEECYRVHDYLAYYRFMKDRLRSAVADAWDAEEPPSYPDPVSHCDICIWQIECENTWRRDDHLTYVAGISTSQRIEVREWGVQTLTRLAAEPTPLQRNPRRGARESYERTVHQARVQVEGRVRDEPIFEYLDVEPERGLSLLPEPSQGDIFFDIEGDPFVGLRGLEYLFGWCHIEVDGEFRYANHWAFNSDEKSGNVYDEEKLMFESFVDKILDRWSQFPDMHVYHFGAYEPSALKRIMGRYGVREMQIDDMLRSGMFVDLYTITRQSIRASVERYSIKDLEPFFGYEREIDLRDANRNRRRLELLLETARSDEVTQEMRRIVGDYNRDDCVSLIRLRDWLEGLRADLISKGHPIPRPWVEFLEPTGYETDVTAQLMELLTAEVPADACERSEVQKAQWLLAQMLRWHSREENTQWWEYFRLAELDAQELLDERAGVSGLSFVGSIDDSAYGYINRYRYVSQNIGARPDDGLRQVGGERLGKIVDIDYTRRTVDVKQSGDAANVRPRAAFVFSDPYVTPNQQSNLLRLAHSVAQNDADNAGNYRAGRDMLLARGPRLRNSLQKGAELQTDKETSLDAARRLVLELDGGVLAVQGPPGTGKTYTGARLICDLVRAGKTVGVTANSHKVIRNLLDMAVEASYEQDADVRIVQKVSSATNNVSGNRIFETRSNGTVLNRLNSGNSNVAAGTAWMWTRYEFSESVDVLIIDEAGQMSLANAIAVSMAAKNLVLLGDPQQLQQPQQASHPDGTEVSALEHLLLGNQTIADDRGIFIAETRRLHPDICRFTSELFYENRLQPLPGLENQALIGSELFQGSGLWFAPVEHEGNQSASVEEANLVEEICADLLSDGASWVDHNGIEQSLTTQDIMIVVPYNAHLAEIRRRMPDARVGTVDMFQGQEAPIVIYSMASSSAEDAPRGMDFLFDLNRLNVATSRARCACIIVASPRLFESECRTPKQMRLANALCRYRELATTIPVSNRR